LDLNIREDSTQGPIDEEHKTSSEENLKNITEEEKESATRIIAAMFKMNQMENYSKVNLFNETKDENWTNIQRKAATESQVLLRNDGNILPLQNNATIAVIGNIAFKGDYLTNNNSELIVNGNEQIKEYNSKFGSFISPLPEIRKLAEQKQVKVISSLDLINEYNKNYYRERNKNALDKIKKVLEQKKNILDAVIVFITANSSEKYSIVEKNKINGFVPSLWNGADELIGQIEGMNAIIVINAPIVDNFQLLDKIKAVLFSGFPGDEASDAIAHILFGEANPSGHLPFALGEIGNDITKPSFLNNSTKIDKKIEKTLKDEFRYNGVDSDGLKNNKENFGIEKYNYSKLLYNNQRCSDKYYNHNNFFPFGFGLSYSSFNYSSNISYSFIDTALIVKFNISNNSPILGQAVPMMFLSFPEIKGYSNYLFKGFEKVEIEGNSNKTVTIVADDHALSYFDSKQNKYIRVQEPIEVCIDLNGNIAKLKIDKKILKKE